MDDIRRFLGDEPSADTERKEYSDKNVPGKDGATAAETHTDGVWAVARITVLCQEFRCKTDPLLLFYEIVNEML